LEGGAGKLLEVELSESLNIASDSTDKSKPKKVLVPFKKEFIGTVDIKDKVIQLMHLWILE
jgi:16S rRNA processing protein RimM